MILPAALVLAAAPPGEAVAQNASENPEARPQAGTGAAGASAERGPDGRASYRVEVAGAEMEVDGALDEAAWARATPIPLPYETAPGDNEAAPVETVCYLTFDDERLYLGCRARDPDPERIRAYITDRDDTDGHDRIIVSVDPFDDARRAFEFGISALGVQSDAVYEEQNNGSDASWDAIWSSAGRITEDGYVVEAGIPFKSIRFPESDGVQTWGFYARRDCPRSELVETRSMRWERGQGCVLCQANRVTGIRGVSPGLNLQVNPTVVARKVDTREAFPDGDLVGGPVEPEAGLDLRWSPTTDLAVNLTANPDFSQVEADAPQVDVNNRFALFFPEKRPFFLEGAELFRTPLQAVFTRTVAEPVFGTKITGKMGANAVGALAAVDRETGLLFPGNQGSSGTVLDEPTTSLFGRYRRDVGGSGTAGVLYTGRLGADYGNHVAGADVFVRPLPAVSLRAQVLGSRTRYPGAVATQFGQPADELRVNPSVELRAGRHVDLRASLNWTRQSRDGQEIFRAAVSELRSVYNFDPRTFFRAIVQLRDTDRNPAMHAGGVEPSRTSATTQLLFSYKVNPLTVLFLGYNG